MGHKLSFLVGLGAGYVLGARTGREKYEQLRDSAQKVKDHPKVRNMTRNAREKADRSTQAAKSRMHQESSEHKEVPRPSSADSEQIWSDESV